MLSERRRATMALLTVVTLTAIVYLPVLTNGFVGFGDDVYVTGNPLIASLSTANLWKILTRLYAGSYQPVTMLSLAVDRWLWGDNPFGYHLSDWVLHLLNTALVFWVCYRLVIIGASVGAQRAAPLQPQGKPPRPQIASASLANDLARASAAIAAALFGLHPLHVESVAWAGQRKDLLCAFFYLLAISFYLRHAANGLRRTNDFAAANSEFRIHNSRFALLFFILALLSSPIAVTLPLVLALVDIYPLRRLARTVTDKIAVPLISSDERRAWREKAPFFGLAAVVLVVTIAARLRGISENLTLGIFRSFRPWPAVHGYWFYLWKAVAPNDLTVSYPIPLHLGAHHAASVIGAGVLAAITTVAWLMRRRWPALATAWACYLVMLAPVCGSLMFGAPSLGDHYSYLPMVGPFLVAGLVVGRINLIGDRGLRPSLRAFAGIAAGSALIACAHLTSRQIAHWHNAESLWSDHLRVYSSSALARFNLGRFYQAKGWGGKAKAEYERCLQIEPRHFEAHLNFGGLLLREGDFDAAAEHLRQAIAERPDHAAAHSGLGMALMGLRRSDEAADQFKRAIALDPRNAEARAGLGQALAEKGNFDAAIHQYRMALNLDPRRAEVHEHLGFAYLGLHQEGEARREFEQAIYLAPRSPDSLIELARFDAASSQPLRALGRLSRAAHSRPNDPKICWLKAEVLHGQGALGMAESLLRQAIDLDPENAESHARMALFLEEQGRSREALEALTKAWALSGHDQESMPESFAEAYRRICEKVQALDEQ
jgi:tetratricopeptide (TPR) repeat protein